MQRFFAQTMEAVDDTNISPAQDFTTENGAQYVQNSYGYPPPTSAFAIDQNLQMPDGVEDYTTSQNKNAGHRQGNGSSSLPEQNGTDDITSSRVTSANNSTTLPPASASAQTPLNPSTKRKSPDDSHEVPTLGESQSGRKRSKVSRACDQCRRKKVKCDSVIDNSGIPSTCSPCLKAGQTCDYSRVPQKRGPSKGYIKELSERVQQVEGQLALQNQGYRASLDGSTTGFPDQPFSPDEEAARRQSSYSQHSPFSDIRREHRFPSIGGWQLSNSNTSFPRDRGSIAIPPDQRPSDHNLPLQPLSIPDKSTKPFWTEYTGFASKSQTVPTEPVSFIDDEKMSLTQYYKNIHPLCPILPNDRENFLRVFHKADPVYQHAFSACLNLLPQEVLSTTGTAMNTKNPHFETLIELENFVKAEAVKTTKPSADDNNLVLLWVQLSLIVISMHNIESYVNVNLPLDDLIRMPLSLCFEIDKAEGFDDSKRIPRDFASALQNATVLARLHTFSVGRAEDLLSTSLKSYWLDKGAPHSHLFNTMLIPVSMLLSSHLTFYRESEQSNPPLFLGMHKWLSDHTLRTMADLHQLDDNHSLVMELRHFLDLLQMRSRFLPVPHAFCLEPCFRLISTISFVASATAGSTYTYNPLSFHTYTVATLTLLELLQCNFQDEGITKMISSSVEKIRGSLSQLIEKREAVSGGAGGRFWANILLDLLQERLSVSTIGEGEAGRNEDEVCVDLKALLRQGYAVVLVNIAARTQ